MILLIRNNCESGFAPISEQVSQLLRGNKYKKEEIKEETLQVGIVDMCITAHPFESILFFWTAKEPKPMFHINILKIEISLNRGVRNLKIR